MRTWGFGHKDSAAGRQVYHPGPPINYSASNTPDELNVLDGNVRRQERVRYFGSAMGNAADDFKGCRLLLCRIAL